MERGADDHTSDAPGLRDLLERGVLAPPARRLSIVLSEHPPLKLRDTQTTRRTLDEQRDERC